MSTENSAPAEGVLLAPIHLPGQDGRQYIVLGADHIGLHLSDWLKRTILEERPDSLCVDLDAARVSILSDEAQWQTLSIREVIKQQLLSALMVNLLLSAYLRKLGDSSGQMPGSELYQVVKTAESHAAPLVLADRDLHITINRAWRSLDFRAKLNLLQMAVRRLFKYKKIGENAAGRLSETDVLSAFLEELIPLQPDLEEILVAERDGYTAQKMRDAPGEKIVAVISAGRVVGVCQALETAGEVDLAELEQIPVVPPLRKWVARIIPLLLLILIIVVGVTQGGEFARENLLFWIAANSFFSGLGAILAGGHILTVLTAIVVAPISPLIPAGPGTVAAIVQAMIRPPLVRDFQTFAVDITQLMAWRRNRILKLFSVMILCGLGSIIGTLLGTSRIIFSFLGL